MYFSHSCCVHRQYLVLLTAITTDVDLDGLLDVVSMGAFAGSLYWHRQITPYQWRQYPISTSVDGIISIATGDLDGDGDIVRGCFRAARRFA